MAKVHDVLEIWQRIQNVHATQKESRAQNKHMTDVGHISDTEEIINAFWSLFQHDGAAAFKLSERSPLPPGLPAKDLPGRQTQILNVHQFQRINRHPVESDEDSTTERISDTEDWLNWNGDLDNPNDSEDDWAADVESDMEPGNGIDNLEHPVQRDVSTGPNVPGLIRPIGKSQSLAEKGLVAVNAIEIRRNKGVKKK